MCVARGASAFWGKTNLSELRAAANGFIYSIVTMVIFASMSLLKLLTELDPYVDQAGAL